jgi:ssDNA-binding Zn-finger/Zn-ribbon topoisomerase 1
MSESLLKKEFRHSDVQRVRNLVNKDYSAKTRSQVGYSRTQEKHKEGDIWEEGEKTWTIKNGIKRNVSKLYSARQAAKIPLSCPKCGGPMKHWLAKKMYKIHGFCFDPCTVEMEDNLKKLGLYDQYEKRMMQGNIKAFISDIEQWTLEFLTQSNDIVTEQGEIESWKNNTETQKSEMLNNLKSLVSHLQSHIE